MNAVAIDEERWSAEASERLATVRLRLVAEFDDHADHDATGADADRRLGDAERAIRSLDGIDPGQLDGPQLRRWLERIEGLRRSTDAIGVAAAGSVDRRNPFRSQGFFSTKSVVKHMCRLSGPEAHRRVQAARLHDSLPAWGDAELHGRVGVAQTELMARIAVNPHIPAAVLERDAPRLLDDAIELPYDEFERRARTWEALADPDGDRASNERRHARRDATLRPLPDGGWTLTGSLPDLAGAEFQSIFAHFVDAEWRNDWAEARTRLGDDAGVSDLQRTEPQRRADALLAMARAAASTPPGSQRPQPTVDVLVDRETFEAHLAGVRRDPADYASVVVRTQDGRRLHPDDVVNAALIGHVRRAVYDTDGTIIDLGRRRRLFRGSSRDAVTLLATVCVWIGCDRPVGWCDVDHALTWRAHGATVPRNGRPLCHGHHVLKERGFEVFRDADGDWHVVDPDGNEIV